jgi:hypothetical protein
MFRWTIETNVTYKYPKEFGSNEQPKCDLEDDSFTDEGPWNFKTEINALDESKNFTTSDYAGSGKKITLKLKDPAPSLDVKVQTETASNASINLQSNLRYFLCIGTALWLVL